MKTKSTRTILYLLLFSNLLIVACSQRITVPSESNTTEVPQSALPTSTVPVITVKPTNPPTPTLPHPSTVHISSDGNGDYATLETAIESVAAESTIILGEGTFHLEEPLEIDKPLTLEGAGSDKTIVTGEGPVAVVRYTGEGLLTIQSITFRREGDLATAIMGILGGEVDFNNCRFTNGASNEDKSIVGAGLIFMNDSAGVVENCEIDKNAGQGILVLDHANPQLINNDIHENGGVGITFNIEENGGLVERNDLEGNDLAGFGGGTDVAILGSFAPDLISNKCSQEGSRFGSSDLGDSSGIKFFSRKGRDGLPTGNEVEDNDCAVVWCSTESGSVLLDLTCRSRR